MAANRNIWNTVEIEILLKFGPQVACTKLGRSLCGCQNKYFVLTGKTVFVDKRIGSKHKRGGSRKGIKNKPLVLKFFKPSDNIAKSACTFHNVTLTLNQKQALRDGFDDNVNLYETVVKTNDTTSQNGSFERSEEIAEIGLEVDNVTVKGNTTIGWNSESFDPSTDYLTDRAYALAYAEENKEIREKTFKSLWGKVAKFFSDVTN